jgi:hypothetical protein
MKKLMTYFIGVFLGIGIFIAGVTGCSIITLPTYHEAEYAQLIEIAALSSEGICTPDQVHQLSELSTRAQLYSKYLPNNELMAQGTEQMDKTIQTLKTIEAPTLGYCSMKLRIIKHMATTLAQAVGGKPR